MNKNKIIYWTTTGIISAMMLFSAFSYLSNPDMKLAFHVPEIARRSFDIAVSFRKPASVYYFLLKVSIESKK